jgi:hypothetical protein
MPSSRRVLGAAALTLLAHAHLSAAAGIIERVLADVDKQPVLLSEVQLLARMKGVSQETALEATIDQRLMDREASRVPQAALTDDEARRACESVAVRATAAGVPAATACALARREAVVLKYARFRFGPQLEQADDPERELAERIDAWVKDLREAAQIRYVR